MYSERFPQDLLEDVMPLVQKNYRVVADANHRAIAGLSMGGGQALAIGLAHQDMFHYVLGYSAAISAQFMDADAVFRDAVFDPAGIFKSFDCFGCRAEGRIFSTRPIAGLPNRSRRRALRSWSVRRKVHTFGACGAAI